MNTLPLLTAAALLALTGAAHAQAGYTVQTEQFPTDPAFTELFGINDAGTVVGTHNATANQGLVLSPTRTFTDLNFPASAQTQITGIADNNTKVGIYVDQAGTTHGFVANPGPQFATFDQSGTAFNQLLGISADGSKFAGYSSIDPAGMILQKAYVGSVTAGTFTDINHLLAANVNSQATGINNAGTAVGFYQPTASTSLGFEDIGGMIGTIDPFGSMFTQALGISTSGEVVGLYTDAAGTQHGYTDIGGTFASFDPAGSLSTTINGVNDHGELVGFYTNANDQVVGFIATPVSEPATLAVFATGLLGAIAVMRRRAAV